MKGLFQNNNRILRSGIHIGVVKKRSGIQRFFFYNRTTVYAAIPQFATLLWKAV
jgi:hypothetical protein